MILNGAHTKLNLDRESPLPKIIPQPYRNMFILRMLVLIKRSKCIKDTCIYISVLLILFLYALMMMVMMMITRMMIIATVIAFNRRIGALSKMQERELVYAFAASVLSVAFGHTVLWGEEKEKRCNI